MPPFTQILVPVDFDDASEPAIAQAISIARVSEARVTLVHAFDPIPLMNIPPYAMPLDIGPIVAGLERKMKALREETAAAWPKTDAFVRVGNVLEQILETAAKERCDLIVVGTHGRRGLERVLLGSVAERIVRLARIPVLTVHPLRGVARAPSAA